MYYMSIKDGISMAVCCTYIEEEINMSRTQKVIEVERIEDGPACRRGAITRSIDSHGV